MRIRIEIADWKRPIIAADQLRTEQQVANKLNTDASGTQHVDD